jgi:hypothetical protein
MLATLAGGVILSGIRPLRLADKIGVDVTLKV